MNNTLRNSTSVYKTYGLCVRFPPKVHSLGFWDKNDPFTYSVPALEVQMVVVFALTHLLHYPLKRLGIPKLLSEIMAGVILGPTLPKKFTDLTNKLFPIDSQGVIGTLTLFGYMLFMFLAGVKVDLSMVKSTGKKAFAVGILALMVPFLAGALTSQVLLKGFIEDKDDASTAALFFVSGLQTMSPFVVVTMLLKELKILNSELGRLAIASSLSCEVLTVTLPFIMNTVRSFMENRSLSDALQRIGLMSCFVLVVLIIIRPAMIWIVKQTPEGRPVKDSYIYSLILVMLLAGAFSHWVGEFPMLGPFIIGFATPDGPPLGSALADKLDTFVSGLFIPLFITVISLRVNLQAINLSSPYTVATIILIIVIFLAKVIACIIPACICRVPFKDALALGLIMSSKGVVQMSFYSFFRDDRAFSEETFALLVSSTAVASVVVPLLVKLLYDPSRKYAGYQKRTIMHSKGGEIRIVLCIHRPDNILAFLNLLDISCPSRGNPIMVYALHLIELRGRAHTLFISHQNHQNPDESTYSGDVVLAFGRYARMHQGGISTLAFTAISPRKLMHEDIFTLAMKNSAALIVIPFHRKWAVDGTVESEDFELRSVNCKILDMAPCSVGILVDRGHHHGDLWQQRQQHVAVIFLGGSDDREALAFAKRMARTSGIGLTMVKFSPVVGEASDENEKKKRLDSEVLNDFINVGGDQVVYVEEVVKDGAETALMVREMVEEFDLIIVGRHWGVDFPQTSGLKEWSELPEMGVIGDILSSSDLTGRASVLVVQQQKTRVL